MPRNAVHFRRQAQLARHYAESTPQPDLRATWQLIGRQFDYLADLSERYGPWGQFSSIGDVPDTPKVVPPPTNDENGA